MNPVVNQFYWIINYRGIKFVVADKIFDIELPSDESFGLFVNFKVMNCHEIYLVVG